MKFFTFASVFALAGAAVAAPQPVTPRSAELSVDSVIKCVDPVLDTLITEVKGLSHGQIVQIETGVQQGKPLEEIVGLSTGLVHVLTNVVSCLGDGLGDVDEELKTFLLKLLKALQL